MESTLLLPRLVLVLIHDAPADRDGLAIRWKGSVKRQSQPVRVQPGLNNASWTGENSLGV
jgi:hypothetical protein